MMPRQPSAATAAEGGRTRALTILRPAYFMENWASALPGVDAGILPTFLLADRAIPMVATLDIGRAAARHGCSLKAAAERA